MCGLMALFAAIRAICVKHFTLSVYNNIPYYSKAWRVFRAFSVLIQFGLKILHSLLVIQRFSIFINFLFLLRSICAKHSLENTMIT